MKLTMFNGNIFTTHFKNLLLLSSFLLLLSPLVNAQTLLGIKGGVNWLSFRDVANSRLGSSYSSLPGFCMGVDVKGLKPWTHHIYLGVSVEYYLNKVNLHALQGGAQVWSEQYIHYTLGMLRFAVYPELYAGNRFRFFFNLGPYLSFLVNSSKTGSGCHFTIPVQNYTVSGSAKDDFKTVDVGLREGLGFSYAVIPDLRISIEENAGIGFLNAQWGYTKPNNIGIFLGVAYNIHHKAK